MNSNPKRGNKTRPQMTSHTNNNSSLQNINTKSSQMRQKSGPVVERAATPEGVYHNGRVMHCTTSLVGCLVHIETKDGNKYEGVLRTFSPDFELVIDYVTKLEANFTPIIGNIGTLLASLQADNQVSHRVIFHFPDVVKLHAINVDLNYATNKGHMMTDTEISRFDSRQLSRDKELVPWDGGAGDSGDELGDEPSANGLSAQNGWTAEDMFRVNESRFAVKSDFNPTLEQYTCPLPQGEGEEYEERDRKASQLAAVIEGDPSRQERYNKENDDDEEAYSAVVRPTETTSSNQHNSRGSRGSGGGGGGGGGGRMPRNNSNYSNNSGPPGARSGGRSGPSSGPLMTSSPAFHNKNSGYNKQFVNTTSNANMGPPYKSQSYREDQVSNYGPPSGYNYSKHDSEDSPTAHTAPPGHQNPLPQRSIDSNRRQPPTSGKRKEELNSDPKYSNEYKSTPGATDSTTTAHKDNTPPGIRSEASPHTKHPNPNTGNSSNTNSSSSLSAISANNKSKSPVNSVDATPVSDKSDAIDDQSGDKELRDRDVTDKGDKPESVDSPPSTGAASEPEVAKKSTLNPNAKSFTPRLPMTPINPSATPPSVSSTPSSTMSMPITGQMTHQVLQPAHSMGQQSHVAAVTQSHATRFTNPLMQMQTLYNVNPQGLTMSLGNPYLIQNMAAMAPTYGGAQSNPSQQRTFRTKAPQQQYTHAVRHDFPQQTAHVAAAVTGHPVLATGPMGTAQQSIGPTVSYQQTMVNNANPQHMYTPHMYTPFHPRMNVNVLQQHSGGMQMAMPQAVQYDPSQLQHIYATGVQLQHLVSQPHQHMTNSGPHSGHSTPQSATPTTPLHGGPAPSPVHHQPNQPPTPTPQQAVMYANVTSPHNQNPGHHQSSGAPYPNIVLLPTGQAMAGGHHSGGHGAPLHPAHALSHNSTQANHHNPGGPPTAILPVQLIASSNAANYNASAGT